MILKYIVYFLLVSQIIGWCVLAAYMRETDKRMQRLEATAKQSRKQLTKKSEMDDKHIVSLAVEVVNIKKRIRYAEKVIGYEYPEKEDPEC